ncbi:hypothetical protein [Streptomyces canus]|jgi:hypothetical protein|uniref:hypothetical protein n=1 Tax=Streptomyces canus TaxID=58343 RepID=UPI002DDC660F|nr:hypothetical protein [Streptomyces canus]WSD85362.1 hypothetical protein OG925_14130 [Streptomyces canus]
MTAVDPFASVPAVLLTLVPGLLALARCWIRHRTTVRTEEENTLRTRIAVQGSDPLRRAEVVRASAELHSPAGRAWRQR